MQFVEIQKATALILIGVIAISGCASYTPVLVKPQLTTDSTQKVTQGGVSVIAEEYGSTTKSTKAFDANLVDDGVLPVLISVANESGKSLSLDTKTVIISDSTGTMKVLSIDDAIEKTKKNAWGRALGWSMIVPIISVPIAATASVMHTNKVNKKMHEDFTAKSLVNGVIPTGKDVFGFIFVEIDPKRTTWSDIKVDLTAKFDGADGGISVTSALPPIVFVPTNPPRQ
jgi:hypothetical protein